MKTAILASLIATAAAFAPAAKDATRSTAALNMAFEDELGAQPPLGFYDPLELVSGRDQEYFDRLRYVEIKHGRIAMLGVVGYLVTEAGIRFDGLISYDGTKFSDIPGGFGALSAVPLTGLTQILLFIGWLETGVMKDSANGAAPGSFPGDLRNGIYFKAWDALSPEEQLEKRAIELNQGRAAMMGLLGLMVHEKLGVDIIPPF